MDSLAFDDRNLSWRLHGGHVSISTLAGRLEIPFAGGAHQFALLATQRGESDLVFRDGEFYLYATCEVTEAPVTTPTGYLGVDLGIVNIATDSDGNRYSGNQLNAVRTRRRRRRDRLQAKGTRSAKRALRRARRKESRFAKDVNHRISKELVGRTKGTTRGIALEDLTYIRERLTVRKAQRSSFSSWAFADLRRKIEYKAQRAGVVVVLVDPRNTSRTCPDCGCVDARNRPNQATFLCISCGLRSHADYIAAVNIGRRAAVNPPYAPPPV